MRCRIRSSARQRRRHVSGRTRSVLRVALPLCLCALLLQHPIAWAAASSHKGAQAHVLPPDVTCARLAHADPTATNGALWGTTILPGLGQPGGWFGVPVCANGVNQASPGGANVSCDQLPAASAAMSGCAPGRATSDGYGLTFQCVELVARFAAWAYGDAPSRWQGDAPYLWLSGHHPAEFHAFPDGGTQAPQPGDILVWGTLDNHGQPWPAGPPGGHVAVVAAAHDGQITFVEENMLGRRGGMPINIPSETTTLTHDSAGRWTLGATYGTNGGRALYGWLHSSRNTGHFPHGATTASVSSTPSVSAEGGAALSPAPAATDSPSTVAPGSQDLPSLTQGVLVTGSGALAELVWSDTHTPTRPTPSTVASTAAGTSSAPPASEPHVMVESLSAPPGMALAPDQKPDVTVLPSGERYIFVRGADGALYSAYTSPLQPGIAWQSLGAPPGVTLTGSVTARWESDGMRVGALGSDGAFWLCSGPAGMLGVWLSLGHPAQTLLQGMPVLASMPAVGGAPASASGAAPETTQNVPPLRALAIGVDERLYEADWSPTNAARPPTEGANALAPGWSAWDAVPLPGVPAPLQGAVVLASDQAEMSQSGAAIDQFALLASDVAGQHWILLPGRQTEQLWSVTPLLLPSATSRVVAAVLQHTQSAPAAAHLDIYVADAEQPTAQSSATPTSAPQSSVTPNPTASPPPPTPTTSAFSPIHQTTQPQSALALQQSVYERTFTLEPPRGVSGQHTGSWTLLGMFPSTSGADATANPSSPPPSPPPSPQRTAAQPTIGSSAVALDLGGLGSALASAQGDTITLLGASGVLQRLEPLSTQSAPGAQSTPITIGSTPVPVSFSDPFSGGALNPAWLITTSSPIPAQILAPAQITAGGLSLSMPSLSISQTLPSTAQTSSSGSTGLETVTAMQGTPASESVITVRVQPGSAWTSSTTARGQAETEETGLLLRLDDWDAVTLALRADHTVAFCATTGGNAPSCSVTSVPAGLSLIQGAYLRITQVGSTLVGAIGADGSQWTTVGGWNIAWLPTASSMLGAYAPPIASYDNTPGGNNGWLICTGVGLFITAPQAVASSTSSTVQARVSSAQFSDFTISSSISAASATSSVGAQPTAAASKP